MSIIGKLEHSILYPFADFMHGTNITRYLKSLKKQQWLGREDIVSLQEKKLRHLIEHSYNNISLNLKSADRSITLIPCSSNGAAYAMETLWGRQQSTTSALLASTSRSNGTTSRSSRPLNCPNNWLRCPHSSGKAVR